MSENDRRKDMVAAAAVAMAQRNIAIAAARYGYVPPVRPATVPVAATPAPAPASMNNDVLVKEAARRRAEREAAEAAEAKAAWGRVIARANGKRNGAAATDEKPAELTGWSKVIAQMNSRVGR